MNGWTQGEDKYMEAHRGESIYDRRPEPEEEDEEREEEPVPEPEPEEEVAPVSVDEWQWAQRTRRGQPPERFEDEARCDAVAGEGGVLHEQCSVDGDGWCSTHGSVRSCEWCGERPATMLVGRDLVCPPCAHLEARG